MLEAKLAHLGRRWSDKYDAGLGAGLGEFGVFGEKSVTGNNGLSTGLFCCINNRFILQIAFRCRRAAYMHGLIRFTNMHAVTISIGIDGNAGYTKTPQRTDDTDSNFTTISDQDFV